MKKVLLLLLSLFLFSCMTLKDPSSEDIGMLLIPHKVHNPENKEFFGNYVYGVENISNGTVREIRISYTNGGTVKYLKPGTYKLIHFRFDYESLHQDSGWKEDLSDIVFEIENGSITVLPLTVTSCIDYDGITKTMYPKLDYTNAADRSMAINHISERDGFELWYINN